MYERLPTHIWISALVRRTEVGGASAFVVQKGDAERGDVLVKLATLDGRARVLVPAIDMNGERVFRDLVSQGVGPNEPDVDAYVARARARDSDLWVIEVEDRQGRHFLTEPVEGESSEN